MMTDIHSCSYHCDRPECIKAQRNYLRERLAQPEQEPVSKYCCHACFDKLGQVFLERMILCPECGNKRCPKATNYELQCTNSNEPNQAGSAFTTYGYSPEAAVAVYTHQPQRDELRERLAQPDRPVIPDDFPREGLVDD